MLKIPVHEGTLSVPRLIWTLASQERSADVVRELGEKYPHDLQQSYRVFHDEAALSDHLALHGIQGHEMVVIFDAQGSGHFTHFTRSRQEEQRLFPSWSRGAQWGVGIHTRLEDKPNRIAGCARHIRVIFCETFEARLTGTFRLAKDGQPEPWFPWGLPRETSQGARERLPGLVRLPDDIDDIIRRLNDGPDLKGGIANLEHAAELPADCRISWLRVPARPITVDERRLMTAVHAIREFERACTWLLKEDQSVAEVLLDGVDLRDARLRHLYLNPPTECFSIMRPDLHWTGDGLFASEDDEMPGGFPQLFHVDRAYGINEERWQRCFAWLFGKGPLLFLVSHEWSKCYLTEVRWFVAELLHQGYPVRLLTTDQMDALEVTGGGVFLSRERIGTIFRLFPIHETAGKLVDIVVAAKDGLVRLVPEFGPWGNKVWFSLFWKYQAFFAKVLLPETLELLRRTLPDSHLVRPRGANSFPFTLGERQFESLAGLRALGEGERDRFVLKDCGAGETTARSYGVLMGTGVDEAKWQTWLDHRARDRQPFLVQTHRQTAVARLEVKHLGRGCAETFDCRLLLRPWMVGNEVVSIDGCAVPANLYKIHGVVPMARTTFIFGSV